MSEFFRSGRVDVGVDPEDPDEVAVSIDGRYAWPIPIELANDLRKALNDMEAWGDLATSSSAGES